MKKMFSVLLALSIVAMLALTGCGSDKDSSSNASGGSNDGTIKIIAAQNQTDPGNPYSVGLDEFKKVAEKESNGKIKVEVHNGTLGTEEKELVQKLKLGAADVVVASPGFMSSTGIKQLDLFSLYYLFNNYDHWEKVVDGDIGEKMSDIINKKSNNNFKVIGYWSAGVRHYYGKKPLHSVDDLKGMKIRTQTSGAIADFWKATGAVPTAIAWGELYQALQQGVVDGAENSYPYFVQQNHHKTKNGKYITETAHTYTTRFMMINGKTFDKMTDKQKKVIQDAAAASVKAERKAVKDQEKEYKQIAIDEGAKVNQIDLAPFKEIAKPIQDKVAKEIGMTDELEKIREMGKETSK